MGEKVDRLRAMREERYAANQRQPRSSRAKPVPEDVQVKPRPKPKKKS